jgi:hypothetical protein
MFVVCVFAPQVRRPAQYYRHLIDKELAVLEDVHAHLRPLLLQDLPTASDGGASTPTLAVAPAGMAQYLLSEDNSCSPRSIHAFQ